MNLKTELIELTERMHSLIRQRERGCLVIPTPRYGWENYRYESPDFRLAHVERYFQDGLLVAHVTCFPHKNCGAPIFGFDVVGSEKTGKVSGAFIDWSPVSYDTNWHNSKWNTDRELPVWAKVFSKKFVAIRPEIDEHQKLFEFAFGTFSNYLEHLMESKTEHDPKELAYIKKTQNEYCHYQSQNPRTLAALTKKIGEKQAREFMTEILFPKIP